MGVYWGKTRKAVETMTDREGQLLYSALCYEEGHPRRTQHILKVYTLAMLLARQAGLDQRQEAVLGAGAILHDIAIKHCKDQGLKATQAEQQQAAPALAADFLAKAGYPADFLPEVLELVLHHHEYSRPRGQLMQLLMEADLIVNCYECPPDPARRQEIQSVFRTPQGRQLLSFLF